MLGAIVRSVEAENSLLGKWCRKNGLLIKTKAEVACLCGRPRDGRTVYAISVEGHNVFVMRHR